jgi:polyhydroxyalkanoate synthesis regulator phasin
VAGLDRSRRRDTAAKKLATVDALKRRVAELEAQLGAR